MLLAIDIGNSTIKFGIFDGEELVHKFSIHTARDYGAEELKFDRLRVLDEEFIRINTVVVASVVPELNDTLRTVCWDEFKVRPIFVDHTFDFGLTISYSPLESLGIDRLVNCAAAAKRYGSPLLVCSFGTATTIDLVREGGEFAGGIIAPGMVTMAEMLNKRTSQLPLVDIRKPENLIGNSTEEAIRSGVFFGYLGLVEGLVERFQSLFEMPIPVVGTGGLAQTVLRETPVLDHLDENLTLFGLKLVGEATLSTSL